MAKILIVHAHHEPQSFSSALARTAAETLAAQGHEVAFSDLYSLGFDPVSDRRNFTTTADSSYLKQQREEVHASANSGFAPDLEAEMQKLEACDLLIFSFPLWWFGLPAILKGWVDRVFASGRFYGRGFWYENGSGKGKRAMVLMTTGGGEAMYGGAGMHPGMEAALKPVHHGMFWFNGFAPLPPFIAWSAAHGSDDDRHEVLKRWQDRLAGIFEETPIKLPHAADFNPETFADAYSRFMVTLKRSGPADEAFLGRVPEQVRQWAEQKREGRILGVQIASWVDDNWQGFITVREKDDTALAALCRGWVLAPELEMSVVRLDARAAT